MAADSPLKQEFRLRDLTTRSVTLFPTRAQITRDIKDITLRPGANQIIIDGLGPTVDEHSIKVEGTGAATITDLTVDLLPNREVHEDIFPSEDEESDDEDDDNESEPDEVEAVKTIKDQIDKLTSTLIDEKERINAASARLVLLDNYSASIKTNPPPHQDLATILKSYKEEREQVYDEHKTSTAITKGLQSQIKKLGNKKDKLSIVAEKAQKKAWKEKTKIKDKKWRKKQEIQKEKQRVKKERDSFWPKKVYRITVTLEPGTLTPATSRRSSIDGDSLVKPIQEPTTETIRSGDINLILSYLTYSASWSPRYDLSLNTTSKSGVLEYGAELTNTTSETWRDAKVVLSTSQTSYQGLNETIPRLNPWHVRLVKDGVGQIGGAQSAQGGNWALYSKHEMEQKQQQFANVVAHSRKPRADMFGHVKDSSAVPFRSNRNLPIQRRAPEASSSFGAFDQLQGAFGVSHAAGGLFGSSAAPTEPQERHRHLFRTANVASENKSDEESDEDMGFGLYDDLATITNDPAPAIAFEEGAWEETGMTTTYDVPGLKTLEPSNSTIKHKIAKIDFRGIIFSHIVVGKLRQVAFLKAQLRNNSKITLLKGPLGLSLDGSFLGQATFPRCSPGESFSLPLGVDPAISITYPKPTVRRSQTGIFSKEDSNVFNRSITITNNKPSAHVELTVLDQVPVSEDERLKIEITQPRGLKVGEKISTGFAIGPASAVPATIGKSRSGAGSAHTSLYKDGQGAAGKEGSGKWGSAEATVKKGGEVTWGVKLNPGQGVKLFLEYEATFPGGEAVVGA